MGAKQVEVEELLRACQEADDPLEIVNRFMQMPAAGVRKTPEEYWVRRVCILAEELVRQRQEAEQTVNDLTEAAEDVARWDSRGNRRRRLGVVHQIAGKFLRKCRGCKNAGGEE